MRKDDIIKIMAIFMIELIIFMPLPLVDALRILHDPNPVVSGSITDDSATVEWSTDLPSTSQVDYGTTKSLGNTELIPDMSTVHLVTLENLQPKTTYYYQMLSIDQSGDFEIDDNRGRYYSFKTGLGADTVPPQITNVSLKALSETTATIFWITDEAATTRVYYGFEGQALSEKVGSAAFVTSHLSTIPVESGKKYSFRAESCDKDGNCANSSLNGFLAGADITPPFINVSLPLFHNENRIDVFGYTEPFSDVKVYVNGELKRRLWPDTTGADGVIRIHNLVLPLGENNVLFEAEDQVGQSATAEFYVNIDQEPPTLIITEAPDEVTPTQTFTIKGSVNEKCTISFDVGLDDTTPPGEPANLEEVSVEESRVEIKWDEVNNTDFGEYAVYRDDIRIGVSTSPGYTDTNVKQGDSYNYRISAVDKYCNEGTQSDSIQIDVPGVPTIQTQYVPVLEDFPLGCESELDEIESSGEFSHTITLEEGLNKIVITATDKGGHTVKYENISVYDSTVPQIVSHNLDQVATTYIPDILIKGQVSEKATVFASVNGDLSSRLSTGFSLADLFGAGEEVDNYAVTDDDGNFEFPVGLNRENPITADEETADMKVGQAWRNEIEIYALDFAGLQSASVSKTVYYSMCGGGSSDWDVDMGGVSPGSGFGTDALTPAVLSPRLLSEGMEVISFPINLSYRGFGTPSITTPPRLVPFLPNIAEEKEWDNSWVSVNPYWDSSKRQGYIQIALNPTIDTQGTAELESALSDHREGQCGLGSFGCFKAHFMFEIDYKVELPMGPTQVPGQQRSNVRVEERTQKNCVQLLIPIDIPLFEAGDLPDWAEGVATFMVNVTQGLIDGIDAVLEPLNQIYTVVTYLCLTTLIVDWIASIREQLTCTTSAIKALEKLIEKGSKDLRVYELEVAQAGLCNEIYKGDGGQPPEREGGEGTDYRNQECNKCQSRLDSKYATERSRNNICDRINCPSAPTLQKFIKDANKKKNIKEHTLKDTEELVSGAAEKYEKFTVGGKGASCIGRNPNFEEVKSLYEDYKKTSKEKSKDSEESGNDRCTGTHVARTGPATGKKKLKVPDSSRMGDASCCGQEYMFKWGPACGFGEEDLFSEIKESLCLSAKAYNKGNEISTEAGSVKCGNPSNRKSGGMCDPSNNVTYDVVKTGMTFKDNKIVQKSMKKTGDVYYVIEPSSGKEGESKNNYQIRMCYIAEDYELSQGETEYTITSKIGCITPANAEDGWDVTKTFQGIFEEDDDTENSDGKPAGSGSELDCEEIVKGNSEFVKLAKTHTSGHGAGSDKGALYKACEEIKDKVAGSAGDFVVWPSSNFITTLRCLCISGLVATLTQLKQIFQSINGCFKSALTTGGFQAGTCESLLSVYICDFIIELIQCSSKSASGGSSSRTDSSGGIGGFFGALSSAGDSVMSDAGGRYGDSPMWQAIFSEQKIMNSICLFAFTGTWDIDIAGMIDSGETLPEIETQVWFPVCKRRFRSADPASGYASWTYQLALTVFPGSDINYRTYLKCSTGFNCDVNEGYRVGECDCNRMPTSFTQLQYPISELSGTAESRDTIDQEKFIEISGVPVRYDTAVFEYTRTNEQGQTETKTAECVITEDGVRPPSYCTFTIPSGFRCGVGLVDEYFAYFNPVSHPNPIYPSGVQAYKLGDTVKFDVDVIQQLPPTATQECGAGTACEYTKYLTVEIQNQLGKKWTVDAPSLGTSGQNRFTVTVPSLGAVDETDFGLPIAGAGAAALPPPGFSLSPEGMYGSLIQDVRLAQPSVTDTVEFFIFINRTKWRAYEVDKKTPITGSWVETKSSNDRVVPDYKGIRAEVRSGVTTTGLTEILIKYVPPAQQVAGGGGASGICQRHDSLNTAQNWRATFTLYDSWKQGGIWQKSDQITAYNGVPQKVDKTFKVVCNNQIQLAPGQQGQVVAGYCNVNNYNKLTQPCWCNGMVRTQAESDPVNTPYDCGPGSTADLQGTKSTYCINYKCVNMSLCPSNTEDPVTNPESCYCPNKEVPGETKQCAAGQACYHEEGCIAPREATPPAIKSIRILSSLDGGKYQNGDTIKALPGKIYNVSIKFEPPEGKFALDVAGSEDMFWLEDKNKYFNEINKKLRAAESEITLKTFIDGDYRDEILISAQTKSWLGANPQPVTNQKIVLADEVELGNVSLGEIEFIGDRDFKDEKVTPHEIGLPLDFYSDIVLYKASMPYSGSDNVAFVISLGNQVINIFDSKDPKFDIEIGSGSSYQAKAPTIIPSGPNSDGFTYRFHLKPSIGQDIGLSISVHEKTGPNQMKPQPIGSKQYRIRFTPDIILFAGPGCSSDPLCSIVDRSWSAADNNQGKYALVQVTSQGASQYDAVYKEECGGSIPCVVKYPKKSSTLMIKEIYTLELDRDRTECRSGGIEIDEAVAMPHKWESDNKLVYPYISLGGVISFLVLPLKGGYQFPLKLTFKDLEKKLQVAKAQVEFKGGTSTPNAPMNRETHILEHTFSGKESIAMINFYFDFKDGITDEFKADLTLESASGDTETVQIIFRHMSEFGDLMLDWEFKEDIPNEAKLFSLSDIGSINNIDDVNKAIGIIKYGAMHYKERDRAIKQVNDWLSARFYKPHTWPTENFLACGLKAGSLNDPDLVNCLNERYLMSRMQQLGTDNWGPMGLQKPIESHRCCTDFYNGHTEPMIYYVIKKIDDKLYINFGDDDYFTDYCPKFISLAYWNKYKNLRNVPKEAQYDDFDHGYGHAHNCEPSVWGEEVIEVVLEGGGP